MPTIHAPPLNPPPAPARPVAGDQVDGDGVPDEPPPAYSAAPGHQSIAQGPQYMDFSGPPPTNSNNNRFVPQHTGMQAGPMRPQFSGNANHSWAGPSTSQWSPNPGSQRLPPPNLPSRPGHGPGSSVPPGSGPTEVPTPGRPLLRDGKVLIYPKGHFCSKCYNTGFKNDDPYHPCKNCWKKHAKPYTQAMSYSWPTNTTDNIDTTTSANNYQRPMTLSHNQNRNQVGGQPSYPQPQRPVMNDSAFRPGMIASGGQTNRLPSGYFPGYPAGNGNAPPPPPPPQSQHYPMMPPHPTHSHSGYPGPGGGGPPQTMFVSHGGSGYGWGGTRAPPGALVVRPGDPRLGGTPCFKCGGTGETVTFFSFDNDLCRACQGVGRVY